MMKKISVSPVRYKGSACLGIILDEEVLQKFGFKVNDRIVIFRYPKKDTVYAEKQGVSEKWKPNAVLITVGKKKQTDTEAYREFDRLVEDNRYKDDQRTRPVFKEVPEVIICGKLLKKLGLEKGDSIRFYTDKNGTYKGIRCKKEKSRPALKHPHTNLSPASSELGPYRAQQGNSSSQVY